MPLFEVSPSLFSFPSSGSILHAPPTPNTPSLPDANYSIAMDYGNFGNYGDGGFNQDAQYSEFNNSQRQLVRSALIPVTIKQIHDSTQPVPDGEFVINNVSLKMISFVGIIRKVDNFTSGVTVTIEDGTGSVDIKKWVDEAVVSAAEESERYLAMENKYVYVTGALKQMQLKKSIQQAHIREITDYNEVLYHMLYAIENHLEAQGLLKSGPKQENGLFVNEMRDGPKLDLADQVMNVISSNTATMSEGVPVGWISDQLGIPVDVVKDKCSQLSELGKVYQGYDEGSYLSI